MATIKLTGIVTREASRVLFKENGAEYVLHNVEITEAPTEFSAIVGQSVLASRTILDKEGKSREGVNLNERVAVYVSQAPDRENPGVMRTFFDIGKESTTASQDMLSSIFGNLVAADTEAGNI